MASAGEAFASIQKGIDSAVVDTAAAFARVSSDTSVGLSRGVTDAQGQLADLIMQVADQTLRSATNLEQTTAGLAVFLGQLTLIREKIVEFHELNNAATAQSNTEGIAFRDASFDHAARAAIHAINEIAHEIWLNEIQETLGYLGLIPGPIGIIFDLTNAAISLARGN